MLARVGPCGLGQIIGGSAADPTHRHTATGVYILSVHERLPAVIQPTSNRWVCAQPHADWRKNSSMHAVALSGPTHIPVIRCRCSKIFGRPHVSARRSRSRASPFLSASRTSPPSEKKELLGLPLATPEAGLDSLQAEKDPTAGHSPGWPLL